MCLFTIYLLPAFIALIVIDVASRPKTLGLISYRTTCGDDTKDVKKNPLSLTAVIKCLAMFIAEKIHHWKSGRPMQVNGIFHSIEKSHVISIYIYIYIIVLYNTQDLHCVFTDWCCFLVLVVVVLVIVFIVLVVLLSVLLVVVVDVGQWWYFKNQIEDNVFLR